jgi:hypothetical protein
VKASLPLGAVGPVLFGVLRAGAARTAGDGAKGGAGAAASDDAAAASRACAEDGLAAFNAAMRAAPLTARRGRPRKRR